MRALILLESLVILALAVGILLPKPAAPATGGGEVFKAGHLLMDAGPGEKAVYRADDGTSLEFVVGPVDRQGKRGPVLAMTRVFRDAAGNIPDNGIVPWFHVLSEHGFVPLTAPEKAADLDRVWILRRIRRVDLAVRNRSLRCWKVDFVDPALPVEAEAVEAWFDERVPVFGLVRWQRNGRTYQLESSSPAWKP